MFIKKISPANHNETLNTDKYLVKNKKNSSSNNKMLNRLMKKKESSDN
jgi:hypothetical protein